MVSSVGARSAESPVTTVHSTAQRGRAPQHRRRNKGACRLGSGWVWAKPCQFTAAGARCTGARLCCPKPSEACVVREVWAPDWACMGRSFSACHASMTQHESGMAVRWRPLPSRSAGCSSPTLASRRPLCDGRFVSYLHRTPTWGRQEAETTLPVTSNVRCFAVLAARRWACAFPAVFARPRKEGEHPETDRVVCRQSCIGRWNGTSAGCPARATVDTNRLISWEEQNGLEV